MERRRNPAALGMNSVWGSPYLSPSMEEHLYQNLQHLQTNLPSHNNNEYLLNQQTPLTPPQQITNPDALISAFNQLNLSTIPPQTPSPLINTPLAETPPPPPHWSFERGVLLQALQHKENLINQLKSNQNLKMPSNGGFDNGYGYGNGYGYDVDHHQPLVNNSSVVDDYFKQFNGTGDFGKYSYLPYYKELASRRLYRDEMDQFNGLQFSSTSQFSPLLNSSKITSLEELRGCIVAVAKDQHGCRFLQKKIEGGKKEDVDMIFAEIRDYVGELMVDQFGNYLVQKLLDTCNGDQRTEILISIIRREGVLVKICCDMHGTRAVQKLLERLTTEQQQGLFAKALAPGTVVLITDVNGHHVVQYCVKHFPNGLKKVLLDSVANHCVDIAMDKSGCCVLQLCVEHSHGEIRERLVAEITRNALVLSQDPYGNYVVQYLLGLKIPPYTARLLKHLEGSFVSLSMQKFSSNVVERCLKESSEDQSTQIVRELVSNPDVLKLLQDPYGNYVIQSALSVSLKTPAFYAIVDLVKMHDISLRSHPYGKRILGRIDQLTK